MAVACGTCHAAAGSKPVLPKAAEPAGGSEVLAHMHAHQHGVAMMYQGLIGPSDEAWTEGAKALKSAPLKPAQLPKSKAAKDGAKAEAETHVLADNAAGATDPKARGAMYAEVVGSCASCHGLYGLVLGEGLPKK